MAIKPENDEIFVCDCNALEHIIRFQYWDSKYDNEENIIYVAYHLQSDSLWERIKTAIKHILGHRSKYGDFGELLLNEDDAKRLAKFLTTFIVQCHTQK